MRDDIWNTDWDDRLDLKTLEGHAEALVDTIEDTGVYDLAPGDAATHGTYTNTFTVVETKKVDNDDPSDKSWHWILQLIRAKFYGNEEEIHLVRRVVMVDDEPADFQLFWFDEEGNESPEDNANYSEILENMDLLLDDDED